MNDKSISLLAKRIVERLVYEKIIIPEENTFYSNDDEYVDSNDGIMEDVEEIVREIILYELETGEELEEG